MAKEAVMAAEAIAYECGVLGTEARLTVEVTVVCRDYCAETYYKALNWVGVPADSDLRRVDKVYYLEDIREDPTVLPPPATLPLPPPEQPFTTQDPSQGIEIPVGFKKRKWVMWGSLGQTKRRRIKEFNILLMPIPPRTPLQLEIWCPRLKLLNPSPRLTPKKILINRRPRYRVLALFFMIFDHVLPDVILVSII